MTIQDKVAEDQAKVAQIQSDLDAANTELAADQAKLAGMQPHLDFLTKLENDLTIDVAALEDAAKAVLQPLVDKAKATIDEMKAFLLNQ